MAESKQMLVVRKDLNMRKGKIAAQCAHASLGVILKMMSKERTQRLDGSGATIYTLFVDDHTSLSHWLNEKFTKICVSVNSEQELLDIYTKASDLGIPSCLITDAGDTEFKGVPTKTCCAIGPWIPKDLNEITSHLPLL